MSTRNALFTTLLGAACLLTACQTAPAGTAPAPAAPLAAPVTVSVANAPMFLSGGEGNARVSLTPRVATGGVRRLLAEVSELGEADIHHLQVTLLRVDGQGAETSKGDVDVPNAQLQSAITFGNLAHNTTYWVLAEAYNAATESAATKISVDADSRTKIEVLTDDQLQAGSLKVQLVPVEFSGEATSSGLTINGGQLEHTGSETVTLDGGGL
jgi:hypothetical protein